MKRYVLAISLILCTSSLEAKVTETTVAVGKLAIVTHVDDISDTPIMHAPLITREVRLEWHSDDRRVRFFLKDDGSDLVGSFDVTKNGSPDLLCGQYGGELRAYQTSVAPAVRWRELQGVFAKSLASACAPAVSAEQRAAYVAEFAAAAADFSPALESMKAAAQEQFGGWRRRCLDYKHIKGTWADFRCVRQSAKEN